MTLYLITSGECSDFTVNELIDGPPNSELIISKALRECKLHSDNYYEQTRKLNIDTYNSFIVDNPQPTHRYATKFSDIYPDSAAILTISKKHPLFDENKYKKAQEDLNTFNSPNAPHSLAIKEWNIKWANKLTEVMKDVKIIQKSLVDFLPEGFKIIDYTMIHSD